ncbi:MAG: RHS repeat-associated core domain-containing protein [Clostridiales bacterium]|nr:RHS repeat-associated core domain-containing protein [Clostridiales bacterium]
MLGLKWNGTAYYYVKNLQGDIIGILDSDGNQVVEYVYETWGQHSGAYGSMAATLGELNPFRYRGYYYDTETGFYYLNSRYYDPETCRFLNADGYVDTGMGIHSQNMFVYCMNNPVMYSDPSGHSAIDAIKAGFALGNQVAVLTAGVSIDSFFGAGTTVVHQVAPPPTQYIPDPSPITVKSGTRTATTISKSGDSTRPVSVYAQGRSDNWFLSSAGLKVNIESFTLNASLGLDNIGISGSVKDGDTTNSFSIKADLSQLKVGFEGSTTVKWDENTNITSYTNASVSGWAIVAVYILIQTGQWIPSPQTS